ncbi:MAG: hypothetical protein JXN64_15910 [Spirochaetes bacterium]|nr:hypothetical protein [Spirochaetota bacterium]
MKIYEDIINGITCHKVNPQSDDERNIARVFLSQDEGKAWAVAKPASMRISLRSLSDFNAINGKIVSK